MEVIPKHDRGERIVGTMERRIGIEQEFFLVDEEGAPSDQADEFQARCQEMAGEESLSPESFLGKVSKGTVEINTPPSRTVADLACAYLASLNLALRAGRELGIKLYPLATYSLPIEPVLRSGPSYELQAHTIGHRQFLHAASAPAYTCTSKLPRERWTLSR